LYIYNEAEAGQNVNGS